MSSKITRFLKIFGAECRIRTDNLLITNQLRYRCANPAYQATGFMSRFVARSTLRALRDPSLSANNFGLRVYISTAGCWSKWWILPSRPLVPKTSALLLSYTSTKYEFYSSYQRKTRKNVAILRLTEAIALMSNDSCALPNSAFSSFRPAVWRYVRHNGRRCWCCPNIIGVRVRCTTVVLIA